MQILDVIGKLTFEFVCPAEVETEILLGANQGYEVKIPDWLNVLPLSSAVSAILAFSDKSENSLTNLREIDEDATTIGADW